jgi:hypothetical protein
MTLLDRDFVPQRPRRRTSTVSRWRAGRPWLAAAAAVVLALGVGYGAGRRGQADTAALRRELRAELGEAVAAMRAELQAPAPKPANPPANRSRPVGPDDAPNLAQAVRELQQARQEDRREWVTTLARMDRRHTADLAVLRDGLVLLAERTGGALEATETQLGALASASRPAPGAALPVTNQK